MGHRLIIYITILHVTTFSITHDSLKNTHTHTHTKKDHHTFIYSLSHIHTLICNKTHTTSHQHLHTP